jgi:hypothetical protein
MENYSGSRRRINSNNWKQEFNGKLSTEKYLLFSVHIILFHGVLLRVYQRRDISVTDGILHRMSNNRINNNYIKRQKFSTKTMINKETSGISIQI